MAAGPPIAVLKDVRLTLGGEPLFTGVDLSLAKGERMALVGRNGAGKTTLLHLIGGLDQPNRGRIERRCRVSWRACSDCTMNFQ